MTRCFHGPGWRAVVLGGRVLGVLELFKRRPEKPDEDLVEVVAAIGRQLGQYVERTRAEVAVRAGEARRSAMFEASLDCIVSMGHDGVVTDFNPAAEVVFGWRRDEIVGQALVERLIPPALRQQHRDGLVRYLATGEDRVLGRRVELTAQRRDGSLFPIELTVARITGDGAPSFSAFIRDITERQRVAQALYDSREQFAELAHTLQTSLLPPELPDIIGMELAARSPAVAGMEVGGDFYDVFRTGRATWGVVMGDVCGKGADAAALTGLVGTRFGPPPWSRPSRRASWPCSTRPSSASGAAPTNASPPWPMPASLAEAVRPPSLWPAVVTPRLSC